MTAVDEEGRMTDDAIHEAAEVLPAIPKSADHDASPLIPYDQIPSQLAEALRSIVNRYELRSGEPLPNTIAVTSAVHGEGVTTISQSLATLIAQEMDRLVCWVDCGWLTANDDAAPLAGQPDLLDLLDDHSKLITAFRTTPDLPQLIRLSPGPVPKAKRNMIVRSPSFEQLLRILADEFDHVVFDVPPVLANANSLALLRQANTSLLVVRHRSTSLTQVERAIEALQPTPTLGVVLNRFRTSMPRRLRRLLEA